jgi:hypothetical protein
MLIVFHFGFVEQIVSFELRDQNLSDSAQQLAELRDEMDRRNDGDAEVAAVGEKRVVDHEALARAAKHLDKPLDVVPILEKLCDFLLALELMCS